jgi:hypothetical protein
VAKDRSLQLPQTGPRLEPELLAERSPSAPIRFERLRLAAASVESEHQLGAETFAVGVRGNEGFELGDERVLAAEGEVCFDPGLERRQSELFETGDLALGERLEREVCQWRPAPECEGFPKRCRRSLCLTTRELPPAELEQRLETMYVELVWRNLEHVARGLREQELFAGSIHKESPQPREIDAQGRVDRLWGSITPEVLDESLARDGLIRVHEEEAEERALLRAPEREWMLIPGDFKRPEDAKLEIRVPLRGSMVRPVLRIGACPGPFVRCIRRV